MKSNLPLALSTVLVLAAAGCSKTDDVQDVATATETEHQTETEMATSSNDSNPFFSESPLYMHYPQFDAIDNSHFKPAFERGMQEHLAEIDAIANNTEAPTLDNTLIPMERSGQVLDRVARVFFAMASANTDGWSALRKIMSMSMASNWSSIFRNSAKCKLQYGHQPPR